MAGFRPPGERIKGLVLLALPVLRDIVSECTQLVSTQYFYFLQVIAPSIRCQGKAWALSTPKEGME